MRIIGRLLIGTACVLVATGCGKEEKPQTPGREALARPADLPGDLGRLVPHDAVGVVRFAPADILQGKLEALGQAFGEDPEEAPDVLQLLLGLAPVGPDQVDRSKPAALVLRLLEGGQLAPPMVILPLKDPAVVSESGGAAFSIAGGYVAFSMVGKPPVGGEAPAIARDLPGGDVSLRFDLERLIEAQRATVDRALAAGVANVDESSRAMVDGVMDWVSDLLDSVESFEAGVTVGDGKLDLDLRFSVREDSPLDKPGLEKRIPLADLATSVDLSAYPLAVMARADMAALIDLYMPFYESMLAQFPADQREAFLAMLEKGKEASRAMGNEIVLGAFIGGGGFRMTSAVQPDDPARYVSLYREQVSTGADTSGMGFRLASAEPLEIDGVTLDTYRMEFDWTVLLGSLEMPPEPALQVMMGAMFGDGSLRYHVGAVKDRVLMLMQPDDSALERAIETARKNSGTLRPGIRAAMDAGEGDPSFVLYFDLRALMQGVTEIMAKAMPGQVEPLSSGAPVDFWLRCGSAGRDFALALHLDLGGLGKVVQSMRGKNR